MYVQNYDLLLGDVFENFGNMCLEIYKLDLARFITGPGWTQEAALRKGKVKLDLFIHTDMLMVEKGIRGGICHALHQYAKPNNKYTKIWDRNKNSLCHKYWDINNLYRWETSQKLSCKWL